MQAIANSEIIFIICTIVQLQINKHIRTFSALTLSPHQ